jgi:hypothetical protein
MERRKQGNGLETILEHWGAGGFLLIAVIGFVVSEASMFFTNLHGKPWIYLAVASLCLQVLGAALIFHAKLPLYRSGRFFTFGIKSIPPNLAGFYRWGWRVFLFGVALSLCLLLSNR